jgi:thiamine pyrophosphokinase
MPAKEVDRSRARSPLEEERLKVLVVASGDVEAADADQLADADLVIAADAGAATLERLGRRPDRLVGDLDSVDPALVERLEGDGVPIERHPHDKDASDTELAVAAAVAAGATEVVVIGALGGARIDHALANVLLLVQASLAGRRVQLVRGRTTVRAVRDGETLELAAPQGTIVSLLPVGDADGVTAGGMRWPLERAQLAVGRTRGLSNVIFEPPASVSVERGALLVVESPPERSIP